MSESWMLWLMGYFWPGDRLLAVAISRLNRDRLASIQTGNVEARQARKLAWIAKLNSGPRALCTQEANQQHYELPAQFFQAVLGPGLKYSSGLWNPGCLDLAQAEQAMLELYAERAQLEDGQQILDLGCGWGSLTLWMARRYPNSRILAVSNSHSQRHYIESRLAQEGLANVQVRTADINELNLPQGHFDRILSVEMLEHVRNYQEVFGLLRNSLRLGGKLFVHVFCHAQQPYSFEPGDGWMERHFFSGGVMPSFDLFLYFDDGLRVEEHWAVCGTHYQKTAQAWLTNLRRSKDQLWPLLQQVYGPRQARRWFVYWQLFFLACAELFGYRQGNEWMLCHLRWQRIV